MDKTIKSIVAISQCLDISARHAVHLKYKRFLFVKIKYFKSLENKKEMAACGLAQLC